MFIQLDLYLIRKKHIQMLHKILLLLLLATPLPAQEVKTWLPISIGIHAFEAGIRAYLGSHPVYPAIINGALGGAISYGGQRMVLTGKPELRFLGLQTVAIGANIAVNSGNGKSPLSTVILPLYPFYIRIKSESTDSKIQLSVFSTLNLIYALTLKEGQINVPESVLAGLPVLMVSGRKHFCEIEQNLNCTRWIPGYFYGGTVVLDSDGYYLNKQHPALTHELMHVTQRTRDAILNSVPISDSLKFVPKWLSLDVITPLWLLSRIGNAAEKEAGNITIK